MSHILNYRSRKESHILKRSIFYCEYYCQCLRFSTLLYILRGHLKSGRSIYIVNRMLRTLNIDNNVDRLNALIGPLRFATENIGIIA